MHATESPNPDSAVSTLRSGPATEDGRTPHSALDESGLPAAQVAAFARSLEIQSAAAADPLPGPLADAFAPNLEPIAGISLRPVVARDLALLRQLDSPLVRQLAQWRKPAGERAEVQCTEEEGWEIIYQFSRPARQAAADLACGRTHFTRLATEFAADLSLGAVSQLCARAAHNLIASFATAVRYDAKPQEGATEVFTAPPATPKTASAGGLTMSAA